MGFVAAVAGKGGVGKTTISALLLRAFLRAGAGPVLMIDADPNSNLNEAVGVPPQKTLGDLMERTMARKDDLPGGMSKTEFIQYGIEECLHEGNGFDLLAMGRPEGPGCYCAANNTLRRHLEILSGNYPVVVIDNEAGMEHLSRRTTAKIDLLLLVSEPSPVGIMTAARIRDLAREMEITVARTGLVINRVSGPSIAARLVEEARRHGLEVLGTVPMDDAVVEQAMAHLPAFRLPDGAPAVKAIEVVLAGVAV